MVKTMYLRMALALAALTVLAVSLGAPFKWF